MKTVYDSVIARDPNQPEFHQAVEEVLDSLVPVIKANPEFLTVVEAIEIEEFKTKRVLELLEAVGVAGGSVLIVTDASHAVLQKSAQNLPSVTVLPASGVNVYDVLRHEHLLLTKAGATAVVERLGAGAAQ